MNEIGKNLKRIRLLQDLSLEQAGKLLNMSASTISKYEKGQIIPDSQKIIAFAQAYNVKTIDILKSYKDLHMKFDNIHIKQ